MAGTRQWTVTSSGTALVLNWLWGGRRLVSHTQPPSNGRQSSAAAAAAEGAEVELMDRPADEHQPGGDAWRENSSDSDESYRVCCGPTFGSHPTPPSVPPSSGASSVSFQFSLPIAVASQEKTGPD